MCYFYQNMDNLLVKIRISSDYGLLYLWILQFIIVLFSQF